MESLIHDIEGLSKNFRYKGDTKGFTLCILKSWEVLFIEAIVWKNVSVMTPHPLNHVPSDCDSASGDKLNVPRVYEFSTTLRIV